MYSRHEFFALSLSLAGAFSLIGSAALADDLKQGDTNPVVLSTWALGRFLALDVNGTYGAFSILSGFEYAVKSEGVREMRPSSALK